MGKDSGEQTQQHISKTTLLLLINSCVCFPLCHSEFTFICQEHSDGRFHCASFDYRIYILFYTVKNKLSCPCASH